VTRPLVPRPGGGSAPRPLPLLAAVLLALAFAAPLAGCGKDRLRTIALANQPPVVHLTQAPAPSASPAYYAYELYWTGFDPDGAVDHYRYCVDPPTVAGAETAWVSTTKNREIFYFPSGDPDSLGTAARPGGFHVFVIEAVDERGLASAPATAAFFTYTVAPTVQFLLPKTSRFIFPQVPPNATFLFTGTDPDGRVSKRPLYYRYHLFADGNSEFDYHTLLSRPDSLRRHYAPKFATWDSISGDTCRLLINNMTTGREFVLAVVSFDEAGAYSPVFSYDSNLLRFFCSYPYLMGPRLTVWNESFTYTYPAGGYNTDPANYLHFDLPGGRTATFNWSAVPQPGSVLKSFRWAMDIESLDDETRRSNEATDWAHWSAATGTNTSATVGPFVGTTPDSMEQHRFCIEAMDTNGLKSLAVIQLRVLRPSFAKPLLFVDDTRLTPDRALIARPDSAIAPSGAWPSAAELDTFFFARGGVRWRCYLPVTLQSPPGIFNGYDFDTVGTRTLRGGAVPLALLAQYRQVVWFTDPATTYTMGPEHPSLPQPTVRWMSRAGQSNVLTEFGLMGGRMWMMGGGIAYNSLLPWNVLSNDLQHNTAQWKGMVFSAAAGELVAGRMLFHTAHWRSEVRTRTPTRATKNTRLFPPGPGAPDYSPLPAVLLGRTLTSDPLPPLRSNNAFYATDYPGEVLSQPNRIVEEVGRDEDGRPQMASVLDTLYFATYGDAGPNEPIMTFYRGAECGSVVFSGFPIWYFQRAQAIQLADFLLQRVWGLSRRPVPR
jgi:hypothetical protein